MDVVWMWNIFSLYYSQLTIVVSFVLTIHIHLYLPTYLALLFFKEFLFVAKVAIIRKKL